LTQVYQDVPVGQPGARVVGMCSKDLAHLLAGGGGALAGAFDGSCARALSGTAPMPARKTDANARVVESLILDKRAHREDRIFHLSATI